MADFPRVRKHLRSQISLARVIFKNLSSGTLRNEGRTLRRSVISLFQPAKSPPVFLVFAGGDDNFGFESMG